MEADMKNRFYRNQESKSRLFPMNAWAGQEEVEEEEQPLKYAACCASSVSKTQVQHKNSAGIHGYLIGTGKGHRIVVKLTWSQGGGGRRGQQTPLAEIQTNQTFF